MNWIYLVREIIYEICPASSQLPLNIIGQEVLEITDRLFSLCETYCIENE
jgi:hypothetical protein